MLSEDRFSPPVAQLRARAASRPLDGVLEEARRRVADAEATNGPDLPALLILIGKSLTTNGEFAEAVRCLTRASDAAVALGDPELEADAASGIGSALLAADDHNPALQHFERAERIADEHGLDRLRAFVLRKMGVSFSIVGRHEQALAHLEAAAKVLAATEGTDLDRLHLRNSMLGARSRAIDSLPESDPSKRPADEALLPEWQALAAASHDAGLEHLELMALGNFAISARRAGRPAQAIEVLEDLVPRYTALDMRPNVVISWNHIGYSYEAIDEMAKARHAFEQALALLERGGSARERLEAYDGLARVCERTGDAWGALEAVKAARAIASSLHDEEAREFAAKREHRGELARLNERWERLVEQDPLTGLSNRRSLEAWLERTNSQSAYFLLLLDIDHFKAINDEFGHVLGDQVLVEIARLLRVNCRERDIPVRYGGEEFVIVLPDTSAVEGLAVAERIRTGISGNRWGDMVASLAVTASIGCACSSEGGGANTLLAKADHRLYKAKRSGRNAVCATDDA